MILEWKLLMCLRRRYPEIIDEVIKIIEFFTSCQSIVVTQLKFKTYYGEKDALTRKAIERIVAKLKINSSVRDH